MYEVRVLPAAAADVAEAARYIAADLGNPAAAERFVEAFGEATASLSLMPYRHRVYIPLRELSHEFRAAPVGGYLAFYWVEEEPEPAVVVARLLHARSDWRGRAALW